MMGYGQTNVYHPFPDSSVMWRMYFHSSVLCQPKGKDLFSIIYAGDTLIGNQSYHKLTISGVQIISASQTNALQCWNSTTGYKGAIRQDINNKKVFIVPPSSSSEQLLYDFNMTVGDTLKGYLAPTNPLSKPDIVQTIDSILIGSTYRKRWRLNSLYAIDFIEGVGSTYGLVEPSPGNITDQRANWLACFKQDGLIQYINTIYTNSCSTIITSLSQNESSGRVKLFPDPFFTQATLQSEEHLQNATLIVYNSVGQEVSRMDHLTGQTFVLKRYNLPGGLYFFMITENGKAVSADKFIIAEE